MSPGLWGLLSSNPILFRGRGGNMYNYVRNRPTTAIDPSGLAAASPLKGSCCGPNVDDWFLVELRTHRAWALATGLKPANPITRLRNFRRYAASIPHKWIDFIALNPNRSQCLPAGCRASAVTLCGKCIGDSELGNIVFGDAGRAWGYDLETLSGGAILAHAFKAVWDRATVHLGFDGPDVSSVAAMCRSIQASYDWKDAQDPIYKNCQPQVLKWKGPHSVPGIPCKRPDPNYREKCSGRTTK
jgi:hypothetical protein